MSRIGKKTIIIPEKVEVKLEHGLVVVKGPKGELKQKIHPLVHVEVKDKEINVKIKNDKDKLQKSLWGTTRQLVSNMILGVTQGFQKQLEINGIGYRAEIKANELILNIGYSHSVNFKIPENIEIKVEKNLITVSGIDKQLVGETAAQIRKVRKPEPYKGKGIKYVDEVIRRKAGKQAKGAGPGVG